MRRVWLPKEREFLKKLGVLRKRPSNWNAQWRRDWSSIPPNEWRLLGHFLMNGDEIPAEWEWNYSQLVKIGERNSITHPGLSDVSKYRKGTLLVFSTPFEILLVVVILRVDAGPVVTQQIRHLMGSTTSKVMVRAAKGGSINAPIWEDAALALANITKQRRGCTNVQGTDWKRGVACYVDSAGSHLNQVIARRAFEKHGIAIRTLIKNCSHLMQPIDRNLGQKYKMIIKNPLNMLGGDWRILKDLDLGEGASSEKWRQIFVGMATWAAEKVRCFGVLSTKKKETKKKTTKKLSITSNLHQTAIVYKKELSTRTHFQLSPTFNKERCSKRIDFQ